MPDVASFDEIAGEFEERVRRIVWCTVSTMDRKGRPRSRILHPVWEGTTGYIATGRDSFKAKHLAKNPHVSCSYWDPQHETVVADCVAEWLDDPAEKQRIWDLIKGTPEPYGYDPAMFWPDGPTSSSFGALKLTPWRIELFSVQDMASRSGPRVWRPAT
jgi:general stress protein 26